MAVEAVSTSKPLPAEGVADEVQQGGRVLDDQDTGAERRWREELAVENRGLYADFDLASG